MAQFIYISVAHTVFFKTYGRELYKKPDNHIHYAHFTGVINTPLQLKVS